MLVENVLILRMTVQDRSDLQKWSGVVTPGVLRRPYAILWHCLVRARRCSLRL